MSAPLPPIVCPFCNSSGLRLDASGQLHSCAACNGAGLFVVDVANEVFITPLATVAHYSRRHAP